MANKMFIGSDPDSNYVPKLIKEMDNQPLPAGLHHVEVKHDRWCRIFKGKACNCNPDIEFVK